MRSSWLFLVILCVSNQVSAQYKGYTAVADPQVFSKNFSAASVNTSSIKSDFVQEKNMSLLAEKIVSRGKFWFRKNNQVRMEYTQPFEYLMIINNDNVLVRDGQKENRLSARSNKLFQQINRITIDCVQGTFLSNKDFSSRVFENKTEYLVELTPRSKAVRDIFKSILVTVDKKDLGVTKVDMNEQSGDNTLIRFTNKELNAKLPDALFAVK